MQHFARHHHMLTAIYISIIITQAIGDSWSLGVKMGKWLNGPLTEYGAA